jgi:uncharacterized membrane protein
MAICPKCGAEVDGRYCAKCGAAVDSVTPEVSPASNPIPPAAGGLSENVAGALCYLPAFVAPIIFLLLEPYRHNQLIRFHAFQSIFLNGAMLIVWYLLTIMLPWSAYRLISLLDLAFLVLWIYMIVQTYQGKKVLLPLIGELAARQA